MNYKLITIDEVRQILLDNGIDYIRPKTIDAVEAVVAEVVVRERRRIAYEFLLALDSDLTRNTLEETQVASEMFSLSMPNIDKFVAWLADRAGFENAVESFTKQ